MALKIGKIDFGGEPGEDFSLPTERPENPSFGAVYADQDLDCVMMYLSTGWEVVLYGLVDITESILAQAQMMLEPPVDLVVLFENGLK